MTSNKHPFYHWLPGHPLKLVTRPSTEICSSSFLLVFHFLLIVFFVLEYVCFILHYLKLVTLLLKIKLDYVNKVFHKKIIRVLAKKILILCKILIFCKKILETYPKIKKIILVFQNKIVLLKELLVTEFASEIKKL